MAIAVGEPLPDVTLRLMTSEGPQQMTSSEIFAGRKAVLFAVPGAFTPTCHNRHVPGFLENLDEFKRKGIDTIACVSVNDAFVMEAWARHLGAKDKIVFLADGNGEFTRAVGLETDSSTFGMGLRSRRYAMILEDGVVQAIRVEPSGGQAVESGAEAMLAEVETLFASSA